MRRLRPLAVSTVVFVALLLGLLGPRAAEGHARSHSFSDWTVAGESVSMSFRVAELELRRLGPEASDTPANELLADLLRREVGLRVGASACEAGTYEPLPAAEGFVRVGTRWTCPSGTDAADGELRIEAFFERIPEHLHFAKIRLPDPADGPTTLSERIFSADRTLQPLGDPSTAAVFWDYLVLGVEHILIGIDHLAFLAALLILCRRPRDVVWLITGFTVGHSITLSLAVLGWVRPNIPVIEAFIGFTIALVAAEHGARASRRHAVVGTVAGAGLLGWAVLKVLGAPGLPVVTLVGLGIFSVAYLRLTADDAWADRARPALTVCFGLVHGFGFASVLMDLGLAPGRLAVSLLGFNLGVEVGQLLVVALLVVLALPLRGRPRWTEPLLDASAAVLCALGLFWLVQRGLGVG